MSKLRISLDELLPVKTASQTLAAQLRRLESGEVEHLILTRRNEPRAALITVQRYEGLLHQLARATHITTVLRRDMKPGDPFIVGVDEFLTNQPTGTEGG